MPNCGLRETLNSEASESFALWYFEHGQRASAKHGPMTLVLQHRLERGSGGSDRGQPRGGKPCPSMMALVHPFGFSTTRASVRLRSSSRRVCFIETAQPTTKRITDLEFLRRRLDRRLRVGGLDVAQELGRRAFQERDVPADRRLSPGRAVCVMASLATACPRASQARRKAVIASWRLSVTPPFGPSVGARAPTWVHCQVSLPTLFNRWMRPIVLLSWMTL
jgi:hypothetical protein